MLDLQRHACSAAVRASPVPLLQQVLSQFIACESPLLVFDTADLGVLHRLQVELHQFQTESGNRAQAHESLHPRHDVVYPALQGGSKPALGPAPVFEAWLSIPRVALPAAAAYSASISQRMLDGLPSMRQFCGEDHLAAAIVDEREPCGLAARINLEAERFERGRWYLALEDDREGIALEHGGFARGEQKTCSAGMDGVQWPLVGIEYKDVAHDEPPVARVMVASTRFVSGLA